MLYTPKHMTIMMFPSECSVGFCAQTYETKDLRHNWKKMIFDNNIGTNMQQILRTTNTIRDTLHCCLLIKLNSLTAKHFMAIFFYSFFSQNSTPNRFFFSLFVLDRVDAIFNTFYSVQSIIIARQSLSKAPLPFTDILKLFI